MLRTTVCLLAVAFAFQAAPAHAQTKLRYQFKEGTQEEHVLEQRMKMTVNINGMDIEFKVDQMMEMTWDVKKVNADGTAAVEVRFDRVKMNVDSITGMAEADSANTEEAQDPDGKVLGQVVKALASREMTLTMTPTGTIKDVKLSEAAKKKLAEIPNAAELGAGIDEDTIKAMAQGLVFPEEAVVKGKTWTDQRDIDMPFGKIQANTKYTYEGQEKQGDRNLAVVRSVQELTIEPNPNAKVKIDFKNVQAKSRALFDNATGKVVEQATEVTMRMDVRVGGMTITQNVVQETTIRPRKQ